MYDEELIARLQSITEQPFERLGYTEAVEILKASGQKLNSRLTGA